jgi:hypothetical protein
MIREDLAMVGEQQLKVEMSLGLASNDKFRLRVKDTASRVEFLTVELDPAELATMMASRVHGHITAYVSNLDKVGKARKTQRVSVLRPGHVYDTAQQHLEWLQENYRPPEGWVLADNLRSINSLERLVPGGTMLHFTIATWE